MATWISDGVSLSLGGFAWPSWCSHRRKRCYFCRPPPADGAEVYSATRGWASGAPPNEKSMFMEPVAHQTRSQSWTLTSDAEALGSNRNQLPFTSKKGRRSSQISDQLLCSPSPTRWRPSFEPDRADGGPPVTGSMHAQVLARGTRHAAGVGWGRVWRTWKNARHPWKRRATESLEMATSFKRRSLMVVDPPF